MDEKRGRAIGVAFVLHDGLVHEQLVELGVELQLLVRVLALAAELFVYGPVAVLSDRVAFEFAITSVLDYVFAALSFAVEVDLFDEVLVVRKTVGLHLVRAMAVGGRLIRPLSSRRVLALFGLVLILHRVVPRLLRRRPSHELLLELEACLAVLVILFGLELLWYTRFGLPTGWQRSLRSTHLDLLVLLCGFGFVIYLL